MSTSLRPLTEDRDRDGRSRSDSERPLAALESSEKLRDLMFDNDETKSRSEKIGEGKRVQSITVGLQSLSVASLEKYDEAQKEVNAQMSFAIHTTTSRSAKFSESGTATEREDDSHYLTAEESAFLSPHSPLSPSRKHLMLGQFEKEDEERDRDSLDLESGSETEKVEIEIGPQHFELLKLLGEGAFGKVVLVQNHFNKRFYAMKVISKKLLKKKNNISYMKSERDILTKLSHPFLIDLHFAFQSKSKLFLVMDFLSGGELFLHLRRRGLILEKEVVFYLGEMILAIEFLHQNSIIHRDLKPENVLLRSDAHICITDFGLAKEIGDGVTTRTLCGTSEYMAPEMLTRNGYGKAVDWWALGALCYEMLVGNPPFQSKNQKELDKKILTEKISTPPYLTAEANSLLRGMLDKDSNKRLGCAKSTRFSVGGVAQLKQHPFFRNIDWRALENLSIAPPIDLRATNYDTPKSPETKAQKDIYSAFDDSEVSALLSEHKEVQSHLAQFFHGDFTTQSLSPSLLEDVLAIQNDAKDEAELSSYEADHEVEKNAQPDGDDDFKNFAFAKTSRFLVTVDQLQAQTAHVQSKSEKYIKNKATQEKQRLIKQKEEEQRKLRQAEADRIVQLTKRKAQLQVEKAKLEKEYRSKKSIACEKTKACSDALTLCQTNSQAAEEQLNNVGKKIKQLRKKAKDIEALKEQQKSKKLDKDQLLKLSKEQEILSELNELENEERTIRGQKEGEIARSIENATAALKSAEDEYSSLQNEFYCEEEGNHGALFKIQQSLLQIEAELEEKQKKPQNNTNNKKNKANNQEKEKQPRTEAAGKEKEKEKAEDGKTLVREETQPMKSMEQKDAEAPKEQSFAWNTTATPSTKSSASKTWATAATTATTTTATVTLPSATSGASNVTAVPEPKAVSKASVAATTKPVQKNDEWEVVKKVKSTKKK